MHASSCCAETQGWQAAMQLPMDESGMLTPLSDSETGAQPCSRSGAGWDQMWVMDNSTGAVMAAGSITLADSVCLEACRSTSYAQGACGLVDNNVGASPYSLLGNLQPCMMWFVAACFGWG